MAVGADFAYTTANGSVRVDGLKQIRRALLEVGEDLADLRELMTEVGQTVAGQARRLAPVGETGALERSVRFTASPLKVRVRAGGGKVPYGGVANFGWPDRGRAETGFMQNAETDTRAQVDTEFNRAIRDLVSKHHLYL